MGRGKFLLLLLAMATVFDAFAFDGFYRHRTAKGIVAGAHAISDFGHDLGDGGRA